MRRDRVVGVLLVLAAFFAVTLGARSALAFTYTISSAPNPSAVGQNVTFSVTSAGLFGPSGVDTLEVRDGSCALAAPVIGSTLSFFSPGETKTATTATLTAGTHTVHLCQTSNNNDSIGATGNPIRQVVRSVTATTTTMGSAIGNASPANPAIRNNPITIMATVAAAGPGTPGGTVTFSGFTGTCVETGGNVQSLGATGIARCTVPAPAPPAALSTVVTATYSGDANFAGSAGKITQKWAGVTVTDAPAAASTYGQLVTFTATTTGRGTVFLLDTSVAGATCAAPGAGRIGANIVFPAGGGTASRATSALPFGVHTIDVCSNGADISLAPPTRLRHDVNAKSASSLALTSSQNPAGVGSSVTFTATVATAPTGNGRVTGTVSFFADGAPLCADRPLPGGASPQAASCSTSALAAGDHRITAQYSGDANVNASVAPVQLGPASGVTPGYERITTAPSNITIALNGVVSPPGSLSIVYGTRVVIDVEVTAAPATGRPSGTVSITVLGTSAGPFTLDATGKATIPQAMVLPGLIPVPGGAQFQVSYAGDANHVAATATSAPIAVTQATSTVTPLVSSANPSVTGQSATLTATVASAAIANGGVPTGTVTFLEGATPLGTPALAAGGASLDLSTLDVGAHTLTASYSGDDNFSASTSSDFTQTVDRAATSTSLTASALSIPSGGSLTLTAEVVTRLPGTGFPGGTVDFLDRTTVLGNVPLTAGAATFTTTELTAGEHAITARYNASASYLESTSSAVAVTALPAPAPPPANAPPASTTPPASSDSADAGVIESGGTIGADSGCGCTSAPSSARITSTLALLAVTVLLLRRRKR